MFKKFFSLFKRKKKWPPVKTVEDFAADYAEEYEEINMSWIEKKMEGIEKLPFPPRPDGVTHIVIHHSLTDDGDLLDTKAIRRYHMEVNGWNDIGYHWLIERVGSDYDIFKGREMNTWGAHVVGFNRQSIGICLVGNFDVIMPPGDQWDLAVAFCRRLVYYLNIPVKNILGHREVQKMQGIPEVGRKSCPGDLFDMGVFREDVGKSLKG